MDCLLLTSEINARRIDFMNETVMQQRKASSKTTNLVLLREVFDECERTACCSGQNLYQTGCSLSEVMTACSRNTEKILKAIFAGFFWKTTPYGKIFRILLRTFTWQHRLTLLCSNVVKFVRREISEILRYLPDKKNKQKFGYRYCVDRAKNLPGPAPNKLQLM